MTATEKLRRMLDERGNISLPRERIIRCADCKHYHDGRSADGKRYAEPYCLAIGELAYGALFGVDKLDFCSWAERKEEEAHEEEEGGQMTATDELRSLLDERGVEWEQSPQGGWYTTEWTGRYGKCNAMEWKPTLTVMMPNLTPEQAIAATLGKQGYYTDCDDEGTHITCGQCGEYIGTAEEIAATLGGGERGTHAPHAGSRWHNLFGTPERAARTEYALEMCRVVGCEDCPARGISRVCSDFAYSEESLLEWLRGDA